MGVFDYHDALPRQILVHKDMVSWETPKKAEVRHFVHVALQPWRESLGDHPRGWGSPPAECNGGLKVANQGLGIWYLPPPPLRIFQSEASLPTDFWRLPLDLSDVSFKALGY